ncbi:permease prefix domain 1-containing protein [Brachybacterium sp. AOP42-C2-15]|uniref:permease prefix domain 1-containing protein n=1 Tax=unclassified Brachybacterium TaxID=2623841 RepID=UPI003F9B1767
MNVIDSYLDTLFAPYPETPRLREARTELRAMMEDKQQGLIEDGLPESQAVGQVIAEFGTLEEVAPVLGISAELGRAAAAPVVSPAAPLELERARAYVEAVRRSQWMPAAGLVLFVLSAAPLLLLLAATGAQEASAGWVIGVGVTAVLVMVSLSLLLMMARNARLSDFEDIDEGGFTLTAQVRSYAQEIHREHRRSTLLATAVAITLWILSALPTLLSALLTDGESPATLYGVSGTLVIVALGLAIIARAGWSDSATSTLLQQKEENETLEHSDSPAVRVVAALYWPVMLAAYLIWSFGSGDWGLTWVIWPVAGVLYGALSGLGVALRGDDSARKHGGSS